MSYVPHLMLRAFQVLRCSVPLNTEITHDVYAGQCILITGDNGIGKSTLLRTVQGLEANYRGRCALDTSAFYLPPETPFHPEEQLGDVARLYACLYGISLDYFAKICAEAMLFHGMRVSVGTLSTGQRQRIHLLSLLCCARKLWLLDEPFKALDAPSRDWACGLVRRHLEAGGSALIAQTNFEPLPALSCSVTELPLRASPDDAARGPWMDG